MELAPGVPANVFIYGEVELSALEPEYVALGRVRPNDGPLMTAFAEIDLSRRRAISRAHTATHLVHQTMRHFLGESATQAGSLNAPGRLRFDFNTPQAVPPSVLHDVEQQVNEVLTRDLAVSSGSACTSARPGPCARSHRR